MERYDVFHDILVNLFQEIMDIEEKALITAEFKNISVNDMHIIEAIGTGEPKNMSTVAKLMSVTVGTLTIAINNLVKKGYVHRVRSDADRRVVLVSLTEKGEKAYYHHEEFHREMTNAVLNRLDEKEIPVLMKTLDGLSEFFRGYSSEE